MNYIQDVREAHQMWEYKFKYSGREPISLRSEKPGSLISILGNILHKTAAKAVTGGNYLTEDYQSI